MTKFKTKAKTAYGLLSEIRRLILEEPKRYNQHDALTFGNNEKNPTYWGRPSTYPACGTIGCVAGWAANLTSPRPRSLKNVIRYAQKVLGLSLTQTEDLFDSAAAGSQYQTSLHAAAGAAHITRFMKANARQLKAKRLD